jgi:cyclase
MINEKCIISRIGKRGTLFTFHELEGLETNVYVINGSKHVFVVDTFLGPRSMDVVKKRMARALGSKPVVVVNTHYHWDHVWGNCAFPRTLIVAHAACREKMARIGAKELEAYGKLKQGRVKLVLPNCTFTDKLVFEDDDVGIFHAPGHSADSCSVYDRQDKILFAGDNVEEPLPYLYSKDLMAYQLTLGLYLKHEAKRIIAGHCSKVTKAIIKRNLDYLRAFHSGRTGEYEKQPYRQTHEQNLRALELLGNK